MPAKKTKNDGVKKAEIRKKKEEQAFKDSLLVSILAHIMRSRTYSPLEAGVKSKAGNQVQRDFQKLHSDEFSDLAEAFHVQKKGALWNNLVTQAQAILDDQDATERET